MENSFLDLGLNDVPELSVLPAGEHQVTCKKAKIDSSKNQNRYIMLYLEPTEDPHAKDINHVMMLPSEDATEKQNIMRKNIIKDACEAFNVDFQSGFDVIDFENQTGWAILSVEEDSQYGEQNRVKSFVKDAI